MRIDLTDNSYSEPLRRKDIAALFPIAGKTIGQLCRENENLLIFPYNIVASDDRIGALPILTIDNTMDSETVRVTTGNLMGFIGSGDLKVKIRSRFDAGRDDYFLHYMLQKVFSFNLFELNHDNEQEDVFDFVMFMFPYFLKSALKQGIYREYRHHEHNDARIRGAVNVNGFIRKDMPFSGNVTYSTRDYCHDNEMTQLIRHTIEFMKTRKYGQTVLSLDCETIDNVKCIIGHTPSYDRNERSNVIRKNLRPKMHPYYTEYKPLQSLCIQILRMDEVKYGETDDEICGILFDGAWLWEEYVNTILRNLGFRHPENKFRKGGIYLFEDIDSDGNKHRSGLRYPDFYKDGFVLDAKYKRLGSYDKIAKVAPDDIHQIITYMDCLKAPLGGFVSPLVHRQKKIPTSHLKDSASTLSIYGIEISQDASSYEEFRKRMTESEQEFVTTMGQPHIDNFSLPQ